MKDKFGHDIEVGDRVYVATSAGRSDAMIRFGLVTDLTKSMIMFVELDNEGEPREPIRNERGYIIYKPNFRANYTGSHKFIKVI